MSLPKSPQRLEAPTGSGMALHGHLQWWTGLHCSPGQSWADCCLSRWCSSPASWSPRLLGAATWVTPASADHTQIPVLQTGLPVCHGGRLPGDTKPLWADKGHLSDAALRPGVSALSADLSPPAGASSPGQELGHQLGLCVPVVLTLLGKVRERGSGQGSVWSTCPGTAGRVGCP